MQTPLPGPMPTLQKKQQISSVIHDDGAEGDGEAHNQPKRRMYLTFKLILGLISLILQQKQTMWPPM